MRRLMIVGMIVVCVGSVLAISGSAYGVRVAFSADVLQKKWANGADQFDIWGQLESMLNPPVLVDKSNALVAGPGGAVIVPSPYMTVFPPELITDNPALIVPWRPLPPGRPPIVPGGPFYYFWCKWFTPHWFVPFGSWVRFGLEFDENGCNYGLWLHGMWLQNGIDPPGPPIYGFGVKEDSAGHTFIRIQNASGMATQVDQMDLMVLPPELGNASRLPLDHLDNNSFANDPELSNKWVHLTAGLPRQLNSYVDGTGNTVNSFFDVYLMDAPGLPAVLPPGYVLVARQHSTYIDPSPPQLPGNPPTLDTQEFWQFELHGQPMQPVPLLGDINRDESVNVGDLQSLVAAWGSSRTAGAPYNPNCDLNNDGFVNVGDLQILLANWGKSSSW